MDKDQDGVLSFRELCVVMRALGQRLDGEQVYLNKLCIVYLSETELVKMVKSVSEDKLYNTIEFNEFLKMMSKQKEEDIKEVSLVEAFK